MSSTKQTKKLANQDIVDIYTTSTNNALTSGFQNTTGDYIISSGNDLANPYFIIQNDSIKLAERKDGEKFHPINNSDNTVSFIFTSKKYMIVNKKY
jgi:hypothetical protein